MNKFIDLSVIYHFRFALSLFNPTLVSPDLPNETCNRKMNCKFVNNLGGINLKTG